MTRSIAASGFSGNKKERVPGGAHSQKPTQPDRYEVS
jgi:hypothetical protein